MRRFIPTTALLTGAILFTNMLAAQQADRFAWAITDIPEQNGSWHFLRKLNLQTGEYSSILLSGNDAAVKARNATTKQELATPLKDARYGEYANSAFATGVAAMAYDKKNNRLYYTPMLLDQLRYIDLKTMQVYYVTDQPLTGQAQKSPDQGNIVTRMVIAADGYGYALTNDATQLIRFSAGKKLQITDLGSLVDDPANKGVSVHNSCSSFGGDMVADDDGHLYIFSARNYVFKVNIESKVATHLGTISGLPGNFTVNGAAVTTGNKIIVSSAMESGSYFTVDPGTLAATPYAINGTVWHSSDLANSNLLASGKKGNGSAPELLSRNLPENPGDVKIGVYPNPVTGNQFTVQFNEAEPGNYTVQVLDVMGRQLTQRIVNVGGSHQAQVLPLPANTAKGVYLIKVTDFRSKNILSTKLAVQ